ncbi:uncharacterized protein LY89DRAFT_687453 [Mollisia scopiformis]|uniref:Uncharacterized protein n=1 Tax=Mollisia scopiformis TaxID=149040 RepID=A0A194WZA8_MOLSC|nr:uncharacterized protein LY89DRAFT_687453 [Mollisia scopiformis]KUJ13285.1 hypothetical protein LY89DRAFT_687453 [Mollisia scopiformis]
MTTGWEGVSKEKLSSKYHATVEDDFEDDYSVKNVGSMKDKSAIMEEVLPDEFIPKESTSIKTKTTGDNKSGVAFRFEDFEDDLSVKPFYNYGLKRSRTPFPERACRWVPIPVECSEEVRARFPPKKGTKAKSLTEAEIRATMMSDEDVANLRRKLVNDPPPMSLPEAKKKQIRKDCITFIRGRTTSRLAARAAAEEMNKQ